MTGDPSCVSTRGMQRLVATVQELSLARTLDDVMAIVRTAARRLTGADGATFVLRDGDYCHYVDEDAISPLWKGSRFPLGTCISGWTMLHRTPAVIEDIYADDRIPHEAYRPTFVKSLAMVPIRSVDPVGAIGNYWARPHRPTDDEVRLLRALADTTAVAMENVRVYQELEQRVAERTAELKRANDALATANASLREFVAVAAHDLRSPLASIRLGAEVLAAGTAGDDEPLLLAMLQRQSEHLAGVVDGLMTLSLADSGGLQASPSTVDLVVAARVACEGAGAADVAVSIPDGLTVWADDLHVRRVVGNLVTNAMRYGRAPITVGATPSGDLVEVSVLDDGPGVDPDLVPRLFSRFARGPRSRRHDGAGLGLSIVAALAKANAGTASYRPGTPRGACFVVTLPARRTAAAGAAGLRQVEDARSSTRA